MPEGESTNILTGQRGEKGRKEENLKRLGKHFYLKKVKTKKKDVKG
jgi:hypothetical protein